MALRKFIYLGYDDDHPEDGIVSGVMPNILKNMNLTKVMQLLDRAKADVEELRKKKLTEGLRVKEGRYKR